MSSKRFGRIQKAAAVVPLALLSAAWTASLAGAGTTSAVSAPTVEQEENLPDGTSVPSQAIEAPASVSSPEVEARRGGHGDAAQIVANSSTNAIPSSALAAYQRAETVINSADKACNLTWQLIAAIGRVESNHGRFGGNALDDQGVARPGIFGIPLDGTRNTSTISDTDAGQLDGDTRYDRAVGPMQFIPSTWSVVGVDADNDGQRNPQDVDDAALASAVYLCSGDNDLSTVSGQRAAVYRYNHSTSYVDLVLGIMNSYLAGDFSSVPNGTTAAGVIVPAPPAPTQTPQTRGPGGQGGGTGGDQQLEETPEGDPTSEQPGGDGPAGDGGPEQPQPDDEGDQGGPLPPVKLPPLPSTSVKPVDDVLTLAQAIVQCTLDGLLDNPLKQGDPFDQCIAGYTS